jgi:hypothetical protein
MFLGALVDAGADLDLLNRKLAGLGVAGWTLRQTERTDPRVGGTKVDVVLSEGHDDVHRHLSDILAILRSSTGISQQVIDRAGEVFTVLAEAEAKVHGTTTEAVHFHEVGAVDAIVDVVGTLVGLELLGITSLSCAAIPLGSGTAQCAHGRIPVPVPATMELVCGLPTVPAEGVHPTGELVTPTGAALVRVLCDSFGAPPPMKLDRVAHGLGTRERVDMPNALRIFLGTQVDTESQAVDVLTVTIDDMDSRLFGPLAERQGERIRKGDLVLVEGRMHQSKWTNEKGEPRSKVEVIGQLVRVLGRLARRDGSMDPLFDEDPQVAAGAPPALAVPQIHSSIAADADIHL